MSVCLLHPQQAKWGCCASTADARATDAASDAASDADRPASSLLMLLMNSMKLVIPLHLMYMSIHTKDESKRDSAFAYIFGVN